MKPSATLSPPQRPRRSAVVCSPPKLVASRTNLQFFKNLSAISLLVYEFLPFPDTSDNVEALDRSGKVVTQAKVVRVQNKKLYDRTKIVEIAVKKEYALQVRGIRAKGDN